MFGYASKMSVLFRIGTNPQSARPDFNHLAWHSSCSYHFD